MITLLNLFVAVVCSIPLFLMFISVVVKLAAKRKEVEFLSSCMVVVQAWYDKDGKYMWEQNFPIQVLADWKIFVANKKEK